MTQERIVESLRIRIYEDRSAMGADAANDVGDKIKDLLSKQEFVTTIFAAATLYLDPYSSSEIEKKRSPCIG